MRPSPRQLSIVVYLKAPGTTPDGYAEQQGISVKTVYVQLARLRAKDDEARRFHAWFNGVMGSNPNLRPYMKGIDQLAPKDESLVALDLQEPEKRGAKGNKPQKRVKERRAPPRRKNPAVTKKKTAIGRHRNT